MTDKEVLHLRESDETTVLVGNPNVGKSVIFGLLTGKYVTVSNYPGTSVEITRGKAHFSGREENIIDTPGANGLNPLSEDERVTRDILLDLPHKKVVQVVNSTQLPRALDLTIQLSEMGVPFIIDLNMSDEALHQGISIDRKKLTDVFQVETLATVAVRRKGFDSLKKNICRAKTSPFQVNYGNILEAGIQNIISVLPEFNVSKRFMALNFLCHDDTLLEKYIATRISKENLGKIISVRRELENLFSKPLRQVIHSARIKSVNAILPQVQKVDESNPLDVEPNLNIGTHPMISVVFLGILAFLGQQTFENFSLALVPVWISFFLLSSFLRPNIISSLEKSATHRFYGWLILTAILVFTYYFVGVFGAGTSVDFIENTLFGKYINPNVANLLQNFLPIPFVVDLLVNETYGIITVAITYAVAIILPIVTFFFLLFGILEDSGYLPRLAVMVNHIFKKMGLNGKAVLPMVLGLGCDTMATLTARILPTKKERMIVTLLLALGVPCSAQLGVILGMLSAISVSSIFILSGVILGVMFAVGYLSAKLLPGQSSDFIQELPVIRVPKLYNIFVKTFARVEWYLKEALPLFVLGTFFLFVLHKLNLIHAIEKIASPVVETFLGLPKEATKAFIIGFLRRDYAATEFFTLSKANLLTPLQILVGLVTITLFVPCLANFFIMVKERGLKQATYMIAFIFPFAFLVGGILNHSLKLIGYGV